MALIEYPSELPAPLLDSYAQKKQSNLLRTPMASGRPRQRKRFARVPTELNATWRCKAEQAALFEGFIEHALQGAAAWFLMDVLTPSGLIQHKVRFISDPMQDCKPIGRTHWEYRARIEIESRVVLTEEQTAEGLLAPNTVQQFTQGVDDALDSYQE